MVKMGEINCRREMKKTQYNGNHSNHLGTKLKKTDKVWKTTEKEDDIVIRRQMRKKLSFKK